MTADWASEHGVPAVIGEGYLGYTPLHTRSRKGRSAKSFASSPSIGAPSLVTRGRGRHLGRRPPSSHVVGCGFSEGPQPALPGPLMGSFIRNAVVDKQTERSVA